MKKIDYFKNEYENHLKICNCIFIFKNWKANIWCCKSCEYVFENAKSRNYKYE